MTPADPSPTAVPDGNPPAAVCTCTGGPDYEGPCVWCDVHGQPSVAWEQGVAEGQRRAADIAELLRPVAPTTTEEAR
ncbi:MAG: hypothetical protein ABR549_15605 [Mycobacteriales bacterium]